MTVPTVNTPKPRGFKVLFVNRINNCCPRTKACHMHPDQTGHAQSRIKATRNKRSHMNPDQRGHAQSRIKATRNKRLEKIDRANHFKYTCFVMM